MKPQILWRFPLSPRSPSSSHHTFLLGYPRYWVFPGLYITRTKKIRDPINSEDLLLHYTYSIIDFARNTGDDFIWDRKSISLSSSPLGQREICVGIVNDSNWTSVKVTGHMFDSWRGGPRPLPSSVETTDGPVYTSWTCPRPRGVPVSYLDLHVTGEREVDERRLLSVKYRQAEDPRQVSLRRTGVLARVKTLDLLTGLTLPSASRPQDGETVTSSILLLRQAGLSPIRTRDE